MSLRIVHMTSGHEAHDIRIVKKQCADLAARGHEVFLVCRAQISGQESPLPAGVTLVPVPRPQGRFDRFFKTSGAVRRAAEALDADIYHFHDPELLPHGIRLARKGASVVYDVHEDYRASVRNRGWIPKPLRALISWGVATLEGRMARLGWVSAATPDIAAHFPPERTALVQNFPNLTEFLTQPPAKPAKRPARLVYVGALTEERGILDILRALPLIAKDHPDIGFDLIGSASPALLRQMRAEPGWQYTHFHGRQERAEVVALLAQSQIGVVTLRDVARYRVSQPTKLYEYMAAGLPVVASDFPLWKTLVGADIGAFVIPDPGGIAAGVCEILKQSSQAEAIGVRSRIRAQERFGWEGECDRLEALYDQAT